MITLLRVLLAVVALLAAWQLVEHRESPPTRQKQSPALPLHASKSWPWLLTAAEPDPTADFRRLIASGKPADLWQAHGQVVGCRFLLVANDVIRIPAPRNEASAESMGWRVHASTGKQIPIDPDSLPWWFPPNMTAEQCKYVPEQDSRTLSQWTLIAASAGIPHAIFWYGIRGPFGDPTALESRPDDPLVIEWREQVLAMMIKAIRNGDLGMVDAAEFWTSRSGAFARDREAHYRAVGQIGLAAQESLSHMDSALRENWASVSIQRPTIRLWPEHPNANCRDDFEFMNNRGWTRRVSFQLTMAEGQFVTDAATLNTWCPE